MTTSVPSASKADMMIRPHSLKVGIDAGVLDVTAEDHTTATGDWANDAPTPPFSLTQASALPANVSATPVQLRLLKEAEPRNM